MQNIVLVFFTAALVVIFGIPSVISVAKMKGLYDKPDNRKLHTKKIPRLGGLAIIAGFALAVSMWGTETWLGNLQYLQAAVIVLFVSGLKDDIIGLSPSKKLMGQIAAAAIVVFGEKISITSFYGIFGIHEIPVWVGYPLTIFTIIVITNAFNLIDGVDGLAGGIGFIICTTLGLWFNFIDHIGWSILAFGLAGALFGFLVFNFNPAKIFMGDAGSLTSGFLISIFAIQFIEFNNHSAYNFYKIPSAPALAIAILIIPLFDTIRVFLVRISKGHSPFTADRNHIHHSLIRIGLGHKEVCLVMYVSNIVFVMVAFLLKDSETLTIITIMAVLAIVMSYIPQFIFKQQVNELELDQKSNISQQIEESLKTPGTNSSEN